MKKIANLLFLMILVFMSNTVSAQTMNDFKKDINKIKDITSLSPNQSDQLNQVYEKIVFDLEGIENLKSADEDMFRKKRRSIYKGAQFSISNIFNDDQKDLYLNYQRGLRIKRAKKANKLRKKNAPKDDILDAEVGVL